MNTSMISQRGRALLLGVFLSGAGVVGISRDAVAQEPEASSTAADDRVERARLHFKRGVQLYEDGNYTAALAEIRRAHDVAPNYRLLYNLGQIYMQLHDYAGAMTSFRGYLEQGGGQVPEARRAEVEQNLKDLAGKVGQLRLIVTKRGAEVTVDDVLVGTAPMPQPILVGVGRRKVIAKATGESVTKMVDVAGGDDLTVHLVFGTPATAPAGPVVPALNPKPVSSSPKESAESTPTIVYVGAGVTAVLGIATMTTGLLAVAAHEEFRNKLDRYGASRGSIDDARSKVQSLALVTDIFGGATLAAGIATVAILSSHSSRASAPSVQVGVGPGSLQMAGSF